MITINIIIPIGSFIIGGGVAVYLLTHPEIAEFNLQMQQNSD